MNARSTLFPRLSSVFGDPVGRGAARVLEARKNRDVRNKKLVVATRKRAPKQNYCTGHAFGNSVGTKRLPAQKETGATPVTFSRRWFRAYARNFLVPLLLRRCSPY